jgi:hypothetical protein
MQRRPFGRACPSGQACHALALLRAAFARIGAALAVVGLMLTAFLGTGLANLGAHLAHAASKLAAPRHHGCGKAARLSAIHIQRNAMRHHLHVIFFQAGCGTFIASHGAGIAGVNTGLKAFIRHEVLLRMRLARVLALPQEVVRTP